MLPIQPDWVEPVTDEEREAVIADMKAEMDRIGSKATFVMPVGSPEVKIETQAFVYFNADEPIEIEPIILEGDEVILHDAIRALADAGLLSGPDHIKYKDIINRKPPKSVMKRFREWKARNAR